MKAEDLAVAMEVRGYLPGVKRTKYKVTKLGCGRSRIVFTAAVLWQVTYLGANGFLYGKVRWFTSV